MSADLVFLSDVEPERVAWLSPGRLARGKITILDGSPGLGKTTLLCDWAAKLSRGLALPDGEPSAPRGAVILSAEDGLADTIRPRLEAAGADLAKVAALVSVPDGTPEGRFPSLPLDLPWIEKAIGTADAALVVLDPFVAFLDGRVNAWRDQDVRRALAPIKSLAERTGVAVVAVRHLTKGDSTDPLKRGGGSIGIIGAARCGLLLAADPDDPERRVLASTKSNLARPPASLAFRLVSAPGSDVARVAWEGETNLTATQLLAVPDDGEARSEVGEAGEWLRGELADGPRPAKEVKTAARYAGLKERTVERAKAATEVVARRHGFGPGGQWFWSLPEHLHRFEEQAEPPKTATPDHRPPVSDGGGLWETVAVYGDAPAPNPPGGAPPARCADCNVELPADRTYRCVGCERAARRRLDRPDEAPLAPTCDVCGAEAAPTDSGLCEPCRIADDQTMNAPVDVDVGVDHGDADREGDR